MRPASCDEFDAAGQRLTRSRGPRVNDSRVNGSGASGPRRDHEMAVGYDKPLYLLPFDHRHSYGAEVFGFKEPMSPEQLVQVAASKQVIYEGFKKALESGVPKEKAGILVDEEFGAAILRDAARQ